MWLNRIKLMLLRLNFRINKSKVYNLPCFLRIKDIREDREMKQKDVAEFLNISQTNYSKYELGKINIPNETLKKMSILFDTSIDYLLGLTNEVKPYPRAK